MGRLCATNNKEFLCEPIIKSPYVGVPIKRIQCAAHNNESQCATND